MQTPYAKRGPRKVQPAPASFDPQQPLCVVRARLPRKSERASPRDAHGLTCPLSHAPHRCRRFCKKTPLRATDFGGINFKTFRSCPDNGAGRARFQGLTVRNAYERTAECQAIIFRGERGFCLSAPNPSSTVWATGGSANPLPWFFVPSAGSSFIRECFTKLRPRGLKTRTRIACLTSTFAEQSRAFQPDSRAPRSR